jgi:hypothetical protein
MLCGSLDTPTPEHALPADEVALVELAAGATYPLVAKRAASWLDSLRRGRLRASPSQVTQPSC